MVKKNSKLKKIRGMTFDKRKFKRLIIKEATFFMAASSMLLIILSLVILFNLASHGLATNIFYLKSWGDRALVATWFLGGCFSFGYIIYSLKNTKAKYRPINRAVSIFLGSIFLSTIVPLFNLRRSINVESLKSTIHNTFIFFVVSTLLLCLGYLFTLVITKNTLKKNNWWAFLVGIPYIFIAWRLESEFKNLSNLVNMDTFKYSTLVKMIKDIKYTDVLMLNTLWYQFFALVIIILILMIGMMSFESIWEKTKRWKKVETKEKVKVKG